MELALLKACHNTLIHILTLPDSHPLHHIIHHARRNLPNKHLSPINLLLKQFNISNATFKTIHPVIYIERPTNKYTMTIDKSRKDSIKSEANDNANFKICSDGSGQDNGIGSAAILYRTGSSSQAKLLKAYIGDAGDHNTFKAKIVGAIIALWIIHITLETIGKQVSLYTDNQSIIEALKHGQYSDV